MTQPTMTTCTIIHAPAFEQKCIAAPARCKVCNIRYQSPTTGVLMNACHCGGELVTIGTEIKPVGLDRSDPHSEVRRAHIAVIDGLYGDLLGLEFGEGKLSGSHLRWMCGEVLRNIKTMPVDKMGRWVGFIQGVMACNGLLDVDAERERTRPIFTAAYSADAAKC
jgi:hypothetical protein